MGKLIEKFKTSKLSSRKFLMAVFTLLIVTLNEVVGVGIDPDVYWQLIGIASAYILGESIVDVSNKNDNKLEEGE